MRTMLGYAMRKRLGMQAWLLKLGRLATLNRLGRLGHAG